jgi:hypothetical protein
MGMAVPAAAQQAGQAAPKNHLVSVDPLALIIFGFVLLEYEQGMGDSSTWGMALSHFEWSDRKYSSFDVRARYYLEGQPLKGLAVGTLLGLTRAGPEDPEADSPRGSSLALGVGFTAEQQWLLGDEERLALTVETGGKRLFYVQDREGARRVLPILRLSIGWAF